MFLLMLSGILAMAAEQQRQLAIQQRVQAEMMQKLREQIRRELGTDLRKERELREAAEQERKQIDLFLSSALHMLSKLPNPGDIAQIYPKALQLQEAIAQKVELEETNREGKPGKETAQALKGVARYAGLTRDFLKALIAAERAHFLLPNDFGIESNRAHALMFVGREDESRAIYLARKGKPVSEQDARLWERAIAEDFAEFRKAGLTHPMMADIEKELGVSR
jgi:hypothetical protein